MTLMKGSSLINWILNLKWLLPRLFFFWNLMWIASFTLGLGESDIPVLFLDKRLHPYNINRNSEIEIPEASGCWWSKIQQQESLALMDHRGNLIWRCTNAAMEFHPLKTEYYGMQVACSGWMCISGSCTASMEWATIAITQYWICRHF